MQRAVGGAVVDADDLDVLKRLHPGRLRHSSECFSTLQMGTSTETSGEWSVTHEESSRTIKRTAEAIGPQALT